MDVEELELELIDYGVDEIVNDEDGIILYGAFEEYSNIQNYLEQNGFEIISAEFERIPNDVKEVTPEQRETINKLLEKLEDDEDVQNVFHNMKEEDDEE
jgi:transcriptional/translational regulatory protein YebC/TACO1